MTTSLVKVDTLDKKCTVSCQHSVKSILKKKFLLTTIMLLTV